MATRGFRLGYSLITQYPDYFNVKQICALPPKINGHDIYHRYVPFFHKELHTSSRYGNNLELSVNQSEDFSLLDKHKYNLILISGTSDSLSSNINLLKNIFKSCEVKIINITVELENENYIYTRYLDIVNEIYNGPEKITDTKSMKQYMSLQFKVINKLTDTISFPFAKLKNDNVPVDLSGLVSNLDINE